MASKYHKTSPSKKIESFKKEVLTLLKGNHYLLNKIKDHEIIIKYAHQRLFKSLNCEEIDIPDIGNPYVINAVYFLEDVIENFPDDDKNSFEFRLKACLYQYILGLAEDQWKIPSLWPRDLAEVIIYGDYSGRGIGWADKAIMDEIKWNCERKLS